MKVDLPQAKGLTERYLSPSEERAGIPLLVFSQRPDTTPRHVEEGTGTGARAQGGLNATE